MIWQMILENNRNGMPYEKENGFMKKNTRRHITRNGNRKQNKTGMLLVSGVVVLLCIIFTVNTIRLEGKRKEYSQKIEEYQKDIDQLESESEEIEDLKTYVQTQKYIEQMAREKLGLVYEDEIIFKANEK